MDITSIISERNTRPTSSSLPLPKMLIFRFIGVLAAVLTAVSLVACSTTKDKTIGWSAEMLYHHARELLNKESYQSAVEMYEKLQARYPYGAYAEQANIEMAYAYFKLDDTPSATSAADRFIKLHPNDPRSAYVYYLKGTVYMEAGRTYIMDKLNERQAERDSLSLQQALESFRDGLDKFPDSRYAVASYAKMSEIIKELSAHENYIARFYYDRGAYVAAVNRAKGVLRDYPNSPGAQRDALRILVKSYDALKLPQLRDDARKVLDLNFPNG